MKTGLAATLPSPRPTPPSQSIDPPVTLTPRSQTQTPTKPERTPTRPLSDRLDPVRSLESGRPLSRPPVDQHETPSPQGANAMALSRSGTLSWQQRPLSRGSGSVRNRPFATSRSPIRAPTASPKATVEQPELSRKDIAASLGARDPSWFKQTQDRGLGSAAYRKSQHDDVNADAPVGRSMKLPGLASKTDEDASRPRSRDSDSASAMPPPRDRNLGNGTRANQISKAEPTTQTTASNRPSPLNLSSPPQEESSLGTSTGVPPGRSPSPTKGLGGFVESAMMKRSDSVNKRWSVRANAGLKRGNSVAGGRPTFNPPPATIQPLGHARTLSRDPRPFHDGASSPLSGSRPSSSHQDEPTRSTKPNAEIDPMQETATADVMRPSTPPEDSTLSRSPSKTLDPRRWSPTKASWLESALSKPDSPRPAFAKPEAPSWKVGLERSRSQKEFAQPSEQPAATFEPITTGGLLRSPPMGTAMKPETLHTTVSSAQRSPERLPEVDTKPTLPRESPDQERSLVDKPTRIASNELPTRASTDPSPASEPVGRPLKQQALAEKSQLEQQPARFATPQEVKMATEATATKQPPTLKPKPQTPPKTDFRANLKSRSNTAASANDAQPEFKSVFGKLKPAQRQNYKAPDVLKDNITRGKAGLNLTEGPQKTQRVDEFKDSILEKKEAMRQEGGSIHRKPDASQRDASTAKTFPEVPEALARRQTLHKTKASADDTRATLRPAIRDIASKPEPKPKPTSSPAVQSTKPAVVAKTFTDNKVEASAEKTKKTFKDSGKQEDEGPATVAATTLPAVSLESQAPRQPILQPEIAVAGPRSETKKDAGSISQKASAQMQSSSQPSSTRSPSPEKHGLATRLNPALASLIARGNSPKPAGDLSTEGTPPISRVATRGPTIEFQSDESGSLTHMTKGRARGPKRRTPKPEAVSDPSSESLSKPKTSNSLPTMTPENTLNDGPRQSAAVSLPKPLNLARTRPSDKTSPELSSFTTTSISQASDTKSVEKPALRDDSLAARLKPVVASKSPDLRRMSNNAPASGDIERPSSKASSETKFQIATDAASEAATSKGHSPVLDAKQLPLSRTASPSKPLTPSKSRLNTPRQTRASEPTAEAAVAKFDAKTTTVSSKVATLARKGPTVPIKSLPQISRSATRVANSTSPSSSAKTMVEKLFGTLPRAADRSEFDAEAFLKAQKQDHERVKTKSNQIWEVHGDGKKTALPPQQEHLLYEDSMYLCVHVFETENSSRCTEVYLWCGDAVGEAAQEDAQLFCRKVARENSAKLEVVKQGKENTNFFAALGGIVITRKNKSSAMYMLCGRRHCGHVAFDEVDLSPGQLCSGFPFLISARFGKLYLWKGQGGGADEIGAARLIGMDLGLTGEMEEVNEGSEPADFWEAFPSSSKSDFKASEMWSVRSADFPSRLYRVENERPKSSGGLGGLWGLRAASPPKSSNRAALQDITPYSQSDLDPSSIHLLDAYSTIYM